MSARSETARLILAGHTDTAIAHRLGVHRSTVNRARRALRTSPKWAGERLYAEQLPTGRAFGQSRRQPTSPAQAAANRDALTAALTGRSAV